MISSGLIIPVQPAFGFVVTGPAPRPEVFAFFNRTGARSAPDAGIAPVMQRIVGEFVKPDVVNYIIPCPLNKGAYFDFFKLFISVDKLNLTS